jgi:RNA polymerase sigma-70 factor, ECF subfamily
VAALAIGTSRAVERTSHRSPRIAEREPGDQTGTGPLSISRTEISPAQISSNASSDPGNELMLALQRGDERALKALIAMYNGKLYTFLVRIVGDGPSAEDILQETWLALYDRRDRYQPTYKFSTWLFTIARRKALSELRRRTVRSIVRTLTPSVQNPEARDLELPQQMFSDPDSEADRSILSAMVERALALLPAHQREIIILRDIEGMENEEIAAVLEWTAKPGAIRKRVFDAREAFRRVMLSLGYNER